MVTPEQQAAAEQARRRVQPETAAAETATPLQRAEQQLAAEDPRLLNQHTRLQLAQQSTFDTLRANHDFRTRTEALRRAWEARDESKYEHPAVAWRGEGPRETWEVVQRSSGSVVSKEGPRTELFLPQGALEQIATAVEQKMQAAGALFRFRLLEMDNAITMADVRTYVEQVVLHGQGGISEGDREATILAEIEKMFVIGEQQKVDAALRTEMGDEVMVESDYPLTFRLRTITSPIVIERLQGMCDVAILRQTKELQQRLVERYGEDSPVYQTIAAVYQAVGQNTF